MVVSTINGASYYYPPKLRVAGESKGNGTGDGVPPWAAAASGKRWTPKVTDSSV